MPLIVLRDNTVEVGDQIVDRQKEEALLLFLSQMCRDGKSTHILYSVKVQVFVEKTTTSTHSTNYSSKKSTVSEMFLKSKSKTYFCAKRLYPDIV